MAPLTYTQQVLFWQEWKKRELTFNTNSQEKQQLHPPTASMGLAEWEEEEENAYKIQEPRFSMDSVWILWCPRDSGWFSGMLEILSGFSDVVSCGACDCTKKKKKILSFFLFPFFIGGWSILCGGYNNNNNNNKGSYLRKQLKELLPSISRE